jgi:cell division protein FtsL
VWPRLAAVLRSLPERALIDRLVRGRAWIPVLGLMLVGIVAMQVEVLKLGAGIGRAVQQTTELSARNEALRASVAALGDDQRIESMAAKMGMIMPAPGAVGFLNWSEVRSGRTAASVHAPDSSQFLAAQSKNGAVATTPAVSPAPGAGASASATAGGTTAGGTTAGGTTAGGTTAGGTTAGGSTAAGSTAGGTTAVGSTAAGTAAGASNGSAPSGFSQSSPSSTGTAATGARTSGGPRTAAQSASSGG